MPLHIDGQQAGALADAIGNAFPSLAKLDVVLNNRLSDSISNYQWDYPVLLHELILQKNARYEIDQLADALLAGNANHPELKEFADKRQKHIDGPTSGKFAGIIASAYPKPQMLNDVLLRELNDAIDNYGTPENNAPVVRAALVSEYNSKYNIDLLVGALLQSNPNNGKLLEFAWRHRLINRPAGTDGTPSATDGSLERMLDPVRGFTNVGLFIGRLTQIINCTCQISYPCGAAQMYGTGFLIGNRTVLTNWHVAEKINAGNRRQVALVFDYRNGPDGMSIAEPVTHNLVDHDTDWLVSHLPYHADDGASKPKDEVLNGTRPENCLDFAVLRLAETPGSLPVGTHPSPGDPVRGFIQLRANTDTDFEAGAAVFIFQHPYENGRSLPLQLDWQKPGIIGRNTNRTRVLYDVNTRPGSSGSPCFNARLELIALHHAGGKDWPAAGNCLYNQGIPIGKILDNLKNENMQNKII